MQSGNTATGRNSLSAIISLPYTLFTDFGQFLYQVTTKITPVIAITSVPMLFILLYLVFDNQIFLKDILDDQVMLYLGILTVSDCIIFMLTSLKPLLFLGEAERYLEFCIAPVVIVFTYYLYVYSMAAEQSILLILLVHMSIIIFNFLYLKIEDFTGELRWDYDKNLKGVIEFLNQSQPNRIITVPVKMAYVVSALSEPKHKFYYNLFYEKGKGLQYQSEDVVYFQLIRPDIAYFQKKYGITRLIVQKDRVKFAKTKGIDYNLNGRKPVYENDSYAVYQVEDLLLRV
jgi:hypothetical protein